jgi:alkane 1-monooxygenase
MMVVLAFFPPLWRKVMDPRVLGHYNGDLSKVNVHPPKADKIEQRYGAALAGSSAR